jgi:hypothetical protein
MHVIAGEIGSGRLGHALPLYMLTFSRPLNRHYLNYVYKVCIAKVI